MKNKITKLFLALLAIAATNSVNAQEQEQQPMPDYIRKATNIEFLEQFAKEKAAEYEKAVEIAKDKGAPIEGKEDGKSFALVGFDETTGNLLYVSTHNNSPTKSSLQTANAKPLHLKGIEGAGITVGVWDGGLALPNHVAFSPNRYISKESAPLDDHASHVAGTIAAGEFGNTHAKGFAYKARIYGYSFNNDIAKMTPAATSTTDPIYVSNHSYGINYVGSGANSSILGQYSSRTRDYDVLAYNAPYYTIVTSAGNSRGDGRIPQKTNGKDLLSWAATAKNTIVVAATQGTDDFSGITGLTSVSNVGGVGPFIASFSSYGPTDDFRIKPDIAAKGVDVLSVGIKSLADVYTESGTSMSSPAVAGVVALWQGYYKSVNANNYMRSASVRALMAHTAREAGPAAGPDFMFGWGLIDAAKGVEIIDAAKTNAAVFRELTLSQGATFEYEFEYNGAQPLVATIAWTDPAGTVSTLPDSDVKKLINDLDLRLINTDTNEVNHPWSLVRNWAIPPTSNQIADRKVDNDRDNIEKIEPQNAIAGNYKVVITHKGTLQSGAQNYTLIISGGNFGPVSIENNVLSNLNVYPNPVDSVLNISGDLEVLTSAKANIFDMSGKKLKEVSLNFNSSNATIDVSTLQTGTYILTLTKGESKQSYKFIKK